MAQLKTLLVNGATKLSGTLYANLLKTNTIEVPTEQGGITYGPGSNGQVLKSDGANVYWGTVMPTAPSSDGTYVLQVSVSSGTPTYSWVSLATWQGGSY